VEFGALCRSYDHLRGPILEKMLPLPVDAQRKSGTTVSSPDEEDLLMGSPIKEASTTVDHSNDSVSHPLGHP